MSLKGIFKSKSFKELEGNYSKIRNAYEQLAEKYEALKLEHQELKEEHEKVRPIIEKYAAHNSALQKQVYELQDRLREATGTAIKKADEITKENLKSINDIKAAVNIVQGKQGMAAKGTKKTKKQK